MMKRFLCTLLMAVCLCASSWAAEAPKAKSYDRLAHGYENAASMIWYATTDKEMDAFITAQPHALPADAKAIQLEIPVPGRKGTMALHIYKPQRLLLDKPPIVYYSHGGGYLFRGAFYNSAKYQKMADDLNMAVVTEDYRISKEAAAPAQVEDAYAGLKYIYEHGAEYALNPQKIVIMGDSAGGGLTAALALYNRDHETIPVRGQVLIYPMLDYRTGGMQDVYQTPLTGEFIWPRETNVFAWKKLRGKRSVQDMSAQELGYYSPTFAADLTDLPPAVLYVGDLDLFVNEDLDYASKLIAASVSTQLTLVPGLTHAFDLVNPNGVQTRDFWGTVYRATQAFMAK